VHDSGQFGGRNRIRGVNRCVATYVAMLVTTTVCLAQQAEVKQPASGAPMVGTPKLEVSTSVWDFGEKWAGEPAETTITLRNVGDAPLEVTEVKSSCGCTVAKVKKTLFQPGESEDVKVTYNTKKRTEKVSQRIRVHSNDPTNPVTVIEVKGRVKQLINISDARGLNFGPIGRDDVLTKSVEIECAYTEPLKLKLKEMSSKQFAVQLEEIEAGKRYRLTATTKPPLPDGPIRASAQLLTETELVPEVAVPIWGSVQAPVAVTPQALYVANQADKPTQRVVRVTSRRDKPLKVTSITASDPAIQAEIVPSGAGSKNVSTVANATTVRVTLPPAAQIPAEGAQITITTDDEEYAELVVRVIKQGKMTLPSAAGPKVQITPKPAAPKSPPEGGKP
jgi:transcriptional regulator